MNEDSLLEQLAAEARRRKEPDDDPRWDDLAAGRLDAQARATLIADDPDGERKAQAFDPLGAEFRDRVKAQIGAGVAAAGGSSSTPAPGKPRSPWYGALAASLVAAVALVLFLPRGGDVTPLPGYSSMLRGGAVMRSESDDRPRLASGDRIEIVLTPETAVDRPLTLAGFLQHGGRVRPLPLPPAQWSEFGAARIVATLGDEVTLPPGESVLLIAVGRAGALPAADVVARHADEVDADPEDWRLLRLPVEVGAP